MLLYIFCTPETFHASDISDIPHVVYTNNPRGSYNPYIPDFSYISQVPDTLNISYHFILSNVTYVH